MSHTRLRRLSCASLALCLLGMVPLASALADPVAFDIAAQPMTAALREFAAQAHVQTLFDYGALQSLTTRGLKGRMDPGDALATLLKGSGFAFQRINSRTFAILAASGKDTAVPAVDREPKAAQHRS